MKKTKTALSILLICLSAAILSCNRDGKQPEQSKRQPGKNTPLEVKSTSYKPHISDVKDGMEGVDFEGVTDEQRQLSLKLLNEIPCACGCRQTTVAECRVRVTDCDTGRQQADFIIDQVKAGRSEGQVTRGLYDLILKQRIRGGASQLLSAIGPNESKDDMVSALAALIANVDTKSLPNTGNELNDAREVSRTFLGPYSGIVKYLEGVPDEMYILHGITYELLPVGHRPMFEYFFFRAKPDLQSKLFTYLNSGTPESDMIIGMAEDLFKEPEPRKGIHVDVGQAPARGPEDAPIVLVEFADFQCPYCGRSQQTVNRIWNSYPGKVRHIFKHFPLTSIHPQAEPAARASMAAAKQGKFWEYRKLLFENQRELRNLPFEKYAEQLGLDVEKFKQDMNSPEVKAFVQNDMREGMKLGVQSTPTFVLNGVEIRGAQSMCAFIEAFGDNH